MQQNQNFLTITGALLNGDDPANAIAAAKARNARRQTILAAHYMRLGYTALPALEKAQQNLNIVK